MKNTVKKITPVCLAAVLGAAAFAFVACGDGSDRGAGKNENDSAVYSVYAPDGAPALSLVNAIAQNNSKFEYHVIDSNTVQAQVTGSNPAADFCVLPVNLAAKLLGSGESYQLLGTVTHGNLYFLTTGDNAALTRENLEATLVGKTVGVVQLPNVPGLTLQTVLNDLNAPYGIVSNIEAAESDQINLVAVDATNVLPNFGCDYYLCPEPAATPKINATASAPKPFVAAGDLQEIYGEGGYPQAVLVAKKSIIQNDAVSVGTIISYFEGSGEYLETVSNETVLSLLDGKRTPGLAPSFNAQNLNATVIRNCAVSYVPAKDCKNEINAFLEKLIAVNATAAATVQDAFYYLG